MATKDQLIYRSWLLIKILLGLTGFLYGCKMVLDIVSSSAIPPSGWHVRFILSFLKAICLPCVMVLIPSLLLLISKRKRLVIVFSYAAATTSITMALIATLVLLAKGFIKPLDLVFMVPMFLQIPATAVALAWLTHAVYKKHEPESISVKG